MTTLPSTHTGLLAFFKTKTYKLCFFLVAIATTQPCLAVRSNSGFSVIPPLTHYTFQTQQTKLIVGTSTETATGWNCNSGIQLADKISRLAVVATFYQNACYTDGRYNNSNYLIKRGVVTDATSKQNFVAYNVSEPTQKASDFLGSQHVIYYKFPTKEAYSVYAFNGAANQISKLLDIPATEINTTVFVKIAGLSISAIKGSVTYVFVPSSKRFSTFSRLAPNIEGAVVRNNALVTINKFRYTVKQPLFDTKTDFNYSPASLNSIYGVARQFFIVYNSSQQLGIIWQNKISNAINLTWIGRAGFHTIALSNPRNEILAAATFDGAGSLYYLSIQAGNGAPNTDRTTTLNKITESGALLVGYSLDSSSTGLDMVESFKVASLKYANGSLGLMLARIMHQSSNGLNYQGAIAVVFDANTLAPQINLGQTSGNSIEHVLTSNSNNEFIAIDLGNNYPRGIHLHRFDKTSKASSVVYTFKTQHGQTATSPAGISYPRYDAISTSLVNFYQWSNDYNVYTELGGVIESFDGYSVLFAGEPDSSGNALNNSRVSGILNDARNIGLVKVVRNFPNQAGTEVSDALVLSSGKTESGGYYNFGGVWSAQRNTGVVWLTHYLNKNSANVSRLKAVKLAENKILLLWEAWNLNRYVNTYAMTVDSLGAVLKSPMALGKHVRLNRSDEAFVVGNNVYLVSGNKAEEKLELLELKIK
jgi:hypothetical protein